MIRNDDEREVKQFIGFMALLYAALVGLAITLACGGCYEAVDPDGSVGPKPGPDPIASIIERTAKEFGPDYLGRLADVADDVARRAEAGEFKSWEDVWGNPPEFAGPWSAGNREARTAAFQAIIRAVNDATGGDDGVFDAGKLAQAARQAAAGYRAGAKK